MEGLPEGHSEKLFGTFCKVLWSKGKTFTRRHKKWALQKPSCIYHVMAILNKVEHLVGSLKLESGQKFSKVTTNGVKDPKRYRSLQEQE